jgi:nitroreductase
MVLMPFDTRWEGYEDFDSYYVHNFATDPETRGLGEFMLLEAEAIASQHGKTYLRLDCPSHNVYLNNFYESKGYKFIGTCIDGPYQGNRREKKLRPIRRDVVELIFNRSSYRGAFIHEAVPRADLETIVKAGIAAPSGSNCQTPAFVIIDDNFASGASLRNAAKLLVDMGFSHRNIICITPGDMGQAADGGEKGVKVPYNNAEGRIAYEYMNNMTDIKPSETSINHLSKLNQQLKNNDGHKRRMNFDTHFQYNDKNFE